MKRAAVFGETYENYLAQVARLELSALQGVLGFKMDQHRALIQIFNRRLSVGPEGITDDSGHTPDLAVSVVLCKYLLMAPVSPPATGSLKTFKDFKDAAPLIQYFTNNVEGRIACDFSGHVNTLIDACRQVGAEPYRADLAYQVKFRFMGLPRVPVWLLFNDAEEGFAAQATLLFEQRAQSYLDMESLAILGGQLVRCLQWAADLN